MSFTTKDVFWDMHISSIRIVLSRLPNGQMLNRWLREKNNSSVVRLRFRGAKKVKIMLHGLYIIINISCPRKTIKNRGMSCNLLRVHKFMV